MVLLLVLLLVALAVGGGAVCKDVVFGSPQGSSLVPAFN